MIALDTMIIKEYFIDNIDGISSGIRNFNIIKEDLIQREANILFYPMLSILTLARNVSWFSAFGWHDVTKELYRIGYDIIPESIEHIDWEFLDKKSEQFGLFAEKFNDLLDQDKLISVGEILFTKAFNKKPILILFDKDFDGIEQPEFRCLLNRNNYIALSFCSLYSDIIEPIKQYIKELSFNQNWDLDSFTKCIENQIKGGEGAIIHSLKSQFIKDLKYIKPNTEIMINSKEFIIKAYNYLCWLVAHDTETRFVVYFPSLTIPDLPSGGFMIGFKKEPLLNELISIQEFVNNFFIIKSYLLAELVPQFPNVLSKVAFHRNLEKEELNFKENNFKIASFAFIDMDKLHDFNAKFEHHAGTLAIKILIASITQACKEENEFNYLLGQWGGDEFVLYVRGINSDKMKEILKKAKNNLNNDDIFNNELESMKQEISPEKMEQIKKIKNAMTLRISFSASIASTVDSMGNFKKMEELCDNMLMTFKESDTKNIHSFKPIRGFIATVQDIERPERFAEDYLNMVCLGDNDFLKQINNC